MMTLGIRHGERPGPPPRHDAGCIGVGDTKSTLEPAGDPVVDRVPNGPAGPKQVISGVSARNVGDFSDKAHGGLFISGRFQSQRVGRSDEG